MDDIQRGFSPTITFTVLEDDEQIKARKRFAKFWAEATEAHAEGVRQYEALVEEVKKMPLPQLSMEEWAHKLQETMTRATNLSATEIANNPVWRELDILKIQVGLAGYSLTVECGGEELVPNADGTYTMNFSFGEKDPT